MRAFLFFLLFTTTLAAQSRVTTPTLVDCINNWKRLLLQDGETFSTEKLNCTLLENMYADSFNWYGTACANDSICEITRRSWLPEILAAQNDYYIDTITTSDHVLYKVIFSETGIFTALKQHYVTWREEENTFLIVAHSSTADDGWQKRKKEIASSTIRDKKGKTYYIVNSDTTLFSSRVVYYLTDTLSFFEPGYIDVCYGFDQLGFSTSGNVFVATAKTSSPDKIISIKEISRELNSEVYEDASIVRGGIPCYLPYDSISPDKKYVGTNWKIPPLDWKKSGSKTVQLELYTVYEYGSLCLRSITTIALSKRGKKIKVKKRMIPPPPREGVPF